MDFDEGEELRQRHEAQLSNVEAAAEEESETSAQSASESASETEGNEAHQ